MRGVKICDTMIAQQELQHLLTLPLSERLRIAQRLIDSAVTETTAEPAVVAEPSELSAGAKWLLSMAGMSSSKDTTSQLADDEKIPFLSLGGLFAGGHADTGERADEICRTEIKRRSGFTMKEELPE